MKDIIDSDKNGYLVKAFNEKDYLNSVIKLLNSDDKKRKKLKNIVILKRLDFGL